MAVYFLRRLLLIIPTLLGISVVCFCLIQMVPGGPVEQMIAQLRNGTSQRGGSASQMASISQLEIENIKAYYGFDQPAPIRYLKWMGNMLRLNFGISYHFQEPVLKVIAERLPISLFFGWGSFFLSYLICIPLGVKKAMVNRSWFDTLSSALIFAAYVIPGYALGILLIVFLGGGSYLDWFPISGMTSENFASLSFNAKVIDFLHHMTLPMFCYVASEFAFLTLLMKNSLLEEVKKDYLRTVLAKGVPYKKAIWRHAFRNALIPLATHLSDLFNVMFAGSLLIENVFEINGMGRLVYNSLISRDYNVVLAVIMISSVLTLLGRLFSDFLYVLLDPRITYT